MAEAVVRTQSNEPGEREFLVDAKDICHVLEDITDTEKVLGISLDTDKTNEVSIPGGAFKGMPNPRHLRFHSSEWAQEKVSILHIPEHFNDFPHKHRLIHWVGCPLKIMPPSFRPVHLVELLLQRSKFEKLWEGVQSLSALKKFDMWGSKNLKEIPDLSTATNLVTLNFGACSSLVELPSSIQNLHKLEMLDMSFCENLETLPVNINLQALDHLNLSGCSRLKSFPYISTNILSLKLSQTGIEEVPCLIENFTKLRSIRMKKCKELKYVSLNISKLKHLETVDFSNCLALDEATLDDSISAMVMFPRAELNFSNCINLNQEALLQQQSPFKRLILSGEEVPSYFTHHTTSTSLTNIPLLHTSLSTPLFRFLACAAVDSRSVSTGDFSFLIEVCCRFIDMRGNHFGSASWPLYFPTASRGSHLVIFNCCLRLNEDNAYLAKRNYGHVDIQFRLIDDYSEFRLNGCGIRLSEA
ncbi:hypothetical protein HA466_0013020 [Hirschfeldia incana]|nr:hypothetical protein HA466_0013020 [Hirschfeldia incana]